MDTKIQKLLNDFSSFCQQNSEETLKKYLKGKYTRLFGQTSDQSVVSINWKDELIEAYEQMKTWEGTRARLTSFCEQIISCFQKTLKSKELQIQMLTNQLTHTKSSLQQQRCQSVKLQKDHQHLLQKQKLNTLRALQKLQYKQYQYRQLQQKLHQYQQQIQQIKSTQYQNMINSIKEEDIMNSQAQSLYKENTMLKYQLKEQTSVKNQLSKHVKGLVEEVEGWKEKYYNARSYIAHKLQSKKQQQKHNPHITRTVSRGDPKPPQYQQQQNINLIDFKDDFSFKDSIQNDTNSFIIHNNVPSFLDLQSNSQFFYQTQESPDRCLMERDVLNLTDRDRSTQSRNNFTKHLIRSKKRYVADKENISQNTWDYQQFDHYNNQHKISTFGSKCQYQPPAPHHHNITSNCSISKYVPSPRAFGTQQRSSLLSKHRRIKSSFCGKSIQEFQQYESNNHFIVNSQKLKESMFEDDQQRLLQQQQRSNEETNELVDESSILAYDVNEIVINEQLITSQKSKVPKEQNTPEMFSSIEAKMITSVQVTPIEPTKPISFQKPTTTTSQTPKPPTTLSPTPLDPYYAFFSLTAQCVKLNAKNFNRAISVYFNLQEQYNNVIRKTIPINKWYNYINDQIQTALKYSY